MRIYFRGILQKLVYTELFLVNQNIHYPKYSKYILLDYYFPLFFSSFLKKNIVQISTPSHGVLRCWLSSAQRGLIFLRSLLFFLRGIISESVFVFVLFLAKRLWETFVWQFWEILQVTVSLHSSATWMYHLTISLKLTHRIDQSQGLLSKTSHITELIHLWSLPLNLVLWCLYHLKQVELSSVSWCETGTGVIARKSFRWLLYLAKEKWLWLGWG